MGAPRSGYVPARRMQSVFTHLNGEHPDLFLPMTAMDGDLHMPRTKDEAVSGAEYAALLAELKQDPAFALRTAEGVPGLLRALEDKLSFVPSHTARDISLFDQNKITAAVAACVSEYMQDRGCDLPDRQEQVFLLCSADFSGIQKFIFTVANKGALASLRSRSFLLELMMEHYVDELLLACGVSRANLLYSGGGHCYLLLPNTSAAAETAARWNTRFNEWLMDRFGVQLFIAQGCTPCSGNDLTNTPAAQAPYTAMFRRVSAAIAAHKLHRYSAAQLRTLNSRSPAGGERECSICGRTDRLDDNGRCVWCNRFVDLSGKVLDCHVYLVSAERNGYDFALPGWEGTRYITLTYKETACARMAAGEAVVRVYSKNRAFPELPEAIRLYVGDYSASRSMRDLAAGAKGVTRLAVCRMDVDNLGQAFVAGYRRPGLQDPEKRDEYLNISRTSAFSRQMSLFFKGSINSILEQPQPDGQKLSVAVVYSGGDDVFLVGAWNDVITAALRIREAFAAYCGGALTLSAGISLQDPNFPIRQAAHYCAELEERAKQTPGKNAVSLFDPEDDHTYSWQEFREKVMGEKGKLLEDFFRPEDQTLGSSFLHRILELLQQTGKDRINLARYAYLLARMEPRDGKRRESYQTFSRTMYRWAQSEQDRRQLIAAIILYFYAERKAQ